LSGPRPTIFFTRRCLNHFGARRWEELREAALIALREALEDGLEPERWRGQPGAVGTIRCDPLDGEDPRSEPRVPLAELVPRGEGWWLVVALGRLRLGRWDDRDRPVPPEYARLLPAAERLPGGLVTAERDDHPDNAVLLSEDEVRELAGRVRLN
jgi:hypothetical protein